jgi:hypothetical protein
MTFKKELADLNDEERMAQNGFEMAAGARSNTMKALKKIILEKSTLSASKGETKSEKENLKTEETKARDADQAFLDDLTAKCEAKAKAWDQRSSARAAEITALAEATEKMKGMGGLYNTNAKLVGLVGKGSQVSVKQHSQPVFLQLRSARRVVAPAEKLQQLTQHLNKEASSLNSTPLAMLALQVQTAGPDHFVKVRGLIKDLIKKLKADAEAEATTKGVCDKNMAAAIGKRDKSAADTETASAQIDSTTSAINGLKTDIENLAAEIAELNKDLKDAEELRASEKAQNEKTIANAGEGKKTVDQAIGILNKFYALVQNTYTPKNAARDGKTVDDLAPETFSSDEEYKGKGDASKGIIGILEVIASDFERTSKVTTDAEATSLKDYEALKKDLDQSVKDKAKLKETAETDVETKESDLTGFKDDLKDAETMNEEALEELEKLQAQCVATGETYAQRVAHRNQEIAALKEAMQILNDWQE